MTNININELIDQHSNGDVIPTPGLPGWGLHLPDDTSIKNSKNLSTKDGLDAGDKIYWTRTVNGATASD